MTQIRSFDYGSDYSHDKHTALSAGTLASGVYTGFSLTATGPGTLNVGPGSALFFPGILVTETGSTDLEVVAPSQPSVQTVVYRFLYQRIIGGRSAEILLLSDDLSEYEHGVVLGWIQHPGEGIALSNNHIIPARKWRIDHVLSESMAHHDNWILTPPFPVTPIPPHPLLSWHGLNYEGMIVNSQGTYAGAVSHHVGRGVGVSLRESVSVIGSFAWPSSLRPLTLSVRCKASFGASVLYHVHDTTQRRIGTLTMTGQGETASDWMEDQLDIPFDDTAEWNSGSLFSLVIESQLLPRESSYTQWLKLSVRR